MNMQGTTHWPAIRKRLEALGYEVGPLREGRATIRLGVKCGYIDTSGTVVVPVVYDRVGPFSEGRARVTLGSSIFYIHPDGQRLD